MFKSTLKFALISLIFLLLSTPSFAQDEDTKWYFGVGGGSTEVDTGVSNLTGTASLDESDTGWKIFGGYQLNKYVGFEIGYTDLGEAKLTGNAGDMFSLDGQTLVLLANNTNISAETKAFMAEIVLSLPLGEMTGNSVMEYFTPFVKIGGNYWEADYTVSSAAINQSPSDDDGFDFVGGGGLNINITRNFAIRAEYERFFNEEDIDLFSGSLIIRF